MKRAIVGRVVGFDVGLRGLPDMDRLRRNNDLDRDCRECRVFLTAAKRVLSRAPKCLKLDGEQAGCAE
jgi:hypothetical protein